MKNQIYLIGKLIYLFVLKQYAKLYYNYTSQVFGTTCNLDLVLGTILILSCGLNYVFTLVSIKVSHSPISFFYFDLLVVFTLIYFVQLIIYYLFIVPKFSAQTYEVFMNQYLMSKEHALLHLKIKQNSQKNPPKTKKI